HGAGEDRRRGTTGRRDGQPSGHRRLPGWPPRCASDRGGGAAATRCGRSGTRGRTRCGRGRWASMSTTSTTTVDRRDHLGGAENALLRADELVAGYVPGVNILNSCDLY